MARIGIDCRFAGTGTGLARYTVEITRALLAHDAEWTLFVRDPSWITGLPGSPHIVSAPFAHYSLAEQSKFPAIIKRSGIDLLFVPHFNAPLLCPVPTVITVHDLILHRYPNAAPLMKRLAYKTVFSRAVTKSVGIIAVSEYVAGEIAALTPGIAKKTHVVTEGVGATFRRRSPDEVRSVAKALTIERPYFLYVGNAKQHKNVQLLIDAYHASGVTDADLVLITGGNEAATLRLGVNVHCFGHIGDDALAALYTGARAFVTASLYEGYCLPIAEALACGCPVIASNRAAIPETLGNRGLLIEPDLHAFAAAFRKPPAPPVPIIVGDWDEAGRKTFEVLTSALSGPTGS